MPDILIRDIPAETVNRLKLKAKRHNRSLQQELKAILQTLPALQAADISAKAAAIRKRLAARGKKFTDSAKLMREDRCR